MINGGAKVLDSIFGLEFLAVKFGHSERPQKFETISHLI
jgi:hypothetical protein